jgi:hypothetical protein
MARARSPCSSLCAHHAALPCAADCSGVARGRRRGSSVTRTLATARESPGHPRTDLGLFRHAGGAAPSWGTTGGSQTRPRMFAGRRVRHERRASLCAQHRPSRCRRGAPQSQRRQRHRRVFGLSPPRSVQTRRSRSRAELLGAAKQAP